MRPREAAARAPVAAEEPVLAAALPERRVVERPSQAPRPGRRVLQGPWAGRSEVRSASPDDRSAVRRAEPSPGAGPERVEVEMEGQVLAAPHLHRRD